MYLGVLAFIGCLSPLLTFAWLWQVKEWRIDRLLEHLRIEGYWRQLFGMVRPLIVLVGFIWTEPAIALLAAMTLYKVFPARQKRPVWTKKAIAIVGCSVVVSAVVSGLLLPYPLALLTLPLWQFGVVAAAWLLFRPLDLYLKTRCYQQARALRAARPDLTVIGITGSVGKSTVKSLLGHVLAPLNPAVTPAYVNSDMGVAKWLIKVLQSPGVPKSQSGESLEHWSTGALEHLIVEMGAYRQGEIALLCSIAKPTHGIITYIGTQHIALFGSQEKLLRAKGELVRELPVSGQAFINSDSPYWEELVEMSSAPVTTVGTGNHGDIEANDIEETSTGIRFTVDGTLFAVPLHGLHNVANVLLVIACARSVGMNDSDIQAQLKTYTQAEQTFAVRQHAGVTILDDTHNASPESFKAAIAWARNQSAERKVLVTPGLIEQGAKQDSVHTELGELCNGVFSEAVVLNPRAATYFAKGYHGTMHTSPQSAETAGSGTLVAYVGRVPKAAITHLTQAA